VPPTYATDRFLTENAIRVAAGSSSHAEARALEQNPGTASAKASSARIATWRRFPVSPIGAAEPRMKMSILPSPRGQLTSGFVVGFDSFSYSRTSVRWLSANAVPIRTRQRGPKDTGPRADSRLPARGGVAIGLYSPVRIRELRVDFSALWRSVGSIRRPPIAASRTRGARRMIARIRELRADAQAPRRSVGSIGHTRIAASRTRGARRMMA